MNFEDACRDSFGFLVHRYGFAGPGYEQIGRESFVRFEKGGRTVSISIEPGARPTIELFYPSDETGEPPTPWASKDGVPRTRRFPRLNLAPPADPAGPDSLLAYLRSAAAALESAEQEWLEKP